MFEFEIDFVVIEECFVLIVLWSLLVVLYLQIALIDTLVDEEEESHRIAYTQFLEIEMLIIQLEGLKKEIKLKKKTNKC